MSGPVSRWMNQQAREVAEQFMQQPGYETCPEHGDTLAHAVDLGLEDKADDFHEHLVCSVADCGYEVMAS